MGAVIPLSPADNSTHTNSLSLDATFLTSISFGGQSSITNGQPTSGQPSATENTDGGWTITWVCGRKGSSDVAQSFQNWCTAGTASDASQKMYTPIVGVDNQPTDLNFAFSMNLSGTFQDGENFSCVLYFGQGHSGSMNNWWIGSPSVTYGGNYGTATLTVKGDEGLQHDIVIGSKLSAPDVITMTP